MGRFDLRRKALTAGVAAATLLACTRTPGSHSTVRPPGLLSETGLYLSMAAHTVRPENLPYSPQYPLWSDGAAKARWIHLPRGTAIDASSPDAWVFPVGTKLWKEFTFGRRVETRYMERAPDGTWIYATYVWGQDGREATLAPSGGIPGAVEIRPGVRHDIPGVGDCKACHQGRPNEVLGFDALQLSADRDPLAPHADPAPAEVDLRALAQRGLARGLPREVLERPPRIAARTPRERAALGYLYGNCSHCHRSDGPLAPLGLALEHDVGAAPGSEEPAFQTAVGRASRFLISGQRAGAAQRIAPGSPEESAVAVRMASRNPFVQMPPVGTHLVDEEAVRLVAGWIREDLRGGGGAHPGAHP